MPFKMLFKYATKAQRRHGNWSRGVMETNAHKGLHQYCTTAVLQGQFVSAIMRCKSQKLLLKKAGKKYSNGLKITIIVACDFHLHLPDWKYCVPKNK